MLKRLFLLSKLEKIHLFVSRDSYTFCDCSCFVNYSHQKNIQLKDIIFNSNI